MRRTNPLGRHWLESLLVALIACCWIVPSLLLYRIEYGNEFIYIPLIRVAASAQSDALIPLGYSGFNFIPEHQGLEIISLMLTRATGISIEQLMFLPICGILLPLAYYLLANSLGLSKIISSLLALAISMDPTIVMTSYNNKIYAWTRLLFVVFILIYIKILRKKGAGHLILLLLVFLSVYALYWTDPLLMIVFSLSANLLLLLNHFLSKGQPGGVKISRSFTLSLSIAFIVIFLFFGNFIYSMVGQVIERGTLSQLGDTMISFSNRMLQILGMTKPLDEEFSAQASRSIVGQIQFLRYMLIGLPILYLLVRSIWKRDRTVFADKNTVVLFSLAVVIVFHLTIYSSYGHPSTRNLALFGPLMALLALQAFVRSKPVKVLYAFLLAVLLIPTFVTSYRQVHYHATFAHLRPAAQWVNATYGQYDLNADLGIYGMFAMTAASDQQLTPNYISINQENYRFLIGAVDESRSLRPGILVVDKWSISPLVSTGWGYQEALSGYVDWLDRNPLLQAVYDNRALRVYQIVP